MYGQPYPQQPIVPAPVLDLHAIAKAQAWRKLWIAIGTTIGGIVVGILGLLAGFIVFIGIALFIAGVIGFFKAMAAVTDPTRDLRNLGPTEVFRRQALRAIEAELTPATTSALQVPGGVALLGAYWLVYHDKSIVVVSRREDVLWLYIQEAKRSKKRTLRIHTRSGVVFDIDEAGPQGYLLQALGQAMPHAFSGWDPRLVATPLPYLAQEVDRRRGALVQGYGQGYGV